MANHCSKVGYTYGQTLYLSPLVDKDYSAWLEAHAVNHTANIDHVVWLRDIFFPFFLFLRQGFPCVIALAKLDL